MFPRRFSINWYLVKIIDLLEISPLENQFQDFLVYPIIDSILSEQKINDIELIDCHNFRQFNTKDHNRCKYSVLVKAVPDLLLAKDFFFKNRDPKIFNALESIASIEVKTPNNKCMYDRVISDKEPKKEYDNKLFIELLPSLFKNHKVILTNLRKWEFFDISKVNNNNLENCIETYVKVLELCGFDSATDYITSKNGKNINREVAEKN